MSALSAELVGRILSTVAIKTAIGGILWTSLGGTGGSPLWSRAIGVWFYSLGNTQRGASTSWCEALWPYLVLVPRKRPPEIRDSDGLI
jgi:hypothetical protein